MVTNFWVRELSFGPVEKSYHEFSFGFTSGLFAGHVIDFIYFSRKDSFISRQESAFPESWENYTIYLISDLLFYREFYEARTLTY